MTNVIDFLEKMGQDAQWRHASQNEVGQALASAEIAPALQMAILANDSAQLESLLGQVPFCAVYLPGEEEDDEGEETPSEEPGEEQELSGHRSELVSI